MAFVAVSGAGRPLEVHYDVFADGDRPWVVFAHGAGGNAASWWQQVPVFYEHYNVITFDHRSFGRSRCAAADFDPHRFAGDLGEVLDAAGASRAALVCQSMGGWTGLGFALENPDRVWALVMSHTVGGIDVEISNAARERLGKPPPSQPFGSWAVAADFPEKNVELSHLYNCVGQMNTDFLSIGGVNAFASRRPVVSQAALAGYSTPTLFVTGDKDTVIPREAVEAAHGRLPNSTLVNLGEVGHSSYFESADRFNEVVVDFLLRHHG